MTFPKHDKFTLVEQRLALACKAFCHPCRVRIAKLLNSSGSMHMHELSSQLPLTQPAVSDHVKRLYQTGFLQVTEAGRYNYYRINRVEVLKFRHEIVEYLDMLAGEPEILVSRGLTDEQ